MKYNKCHMGYYNTDTLGRTRPDGRTDDVLTETTTGSHRNCLTVVMFYLLSMCFRVWVCSGAYYLYSSLHISYRIVFCISVSLGTCFVLNCCLYVSVCFLKPDATVNKPQYCEICLCRDHYFAVLVCSELIPNHNQPTLHVRIGP